MNLSKVTEKINISKIRNIADKVFFSNVFPFVTAALTVISTTFGLEPLIVWYIMISMTLITLFCRDVSPIIGLFVFINIIISMKHGPNSRYDWSDPTYMSSPGFIAQAVITVVPFIGSAIYRIIESIKHHRFRITPIFIGLCAYVVALALNGTFSNKYYFMDTLYGLGIGAIMLFMFVFISGNIEVNEGTYKRIAVMLIAFSFALALQLLEAYITLGVIENGSINRHKLEFGWGTYNQFGQLITMCIPAWFYLAAKCKYGYLYLLGVPFNIVLVILSMSRQAMLFSIVILALCIIAYLVVVPKRQKIVTAGILGAMLIVALVVLLIKRDTVISMFDNLINNTRYDSGRVELWKEGLKKFLHNPVFGNGFYDITATEMGMPGYNGASYGFTEAVPYMCHNTVVQLLFACGIVGFILYVVHRTQTVISLINNPDYGRFFIMFTILGILLTSLLDNHMFYPLPLFIYAPLLAVFTVSETKQEDKGKKTIDNTRLVRVQKTDNTTCEAD